MADTLTITDNRTGKQYQIPITDGTIRATDLRQIKTGAGRPGAEHLRPGVHEHGGLPQPHHLHRRRQGHPRYRGYPIEQLAEHSTYLETAYLIIFGELPTDAQLKEWTKQITLHTMLHENIKKLMEGFQYDAHPMGVFLSTVGAFSTFYPDAKKIFDEQSRKKQIHRLIAKVPTHRRLCLPPQHRPPVHLPRQRPELHRQLPEHAVPDDGAEVPGQPGARARARRAVHPARRSRAELQHERDARHRQLARRSVLGDGRRGGGALRSAARRRQRSRAADAERDRHACRTSPASSSA